MTLRLPFRSTSVLFLKGLLLFVFTFCSLSAQDFLRVQDQAIVDEQGDNFLLRGMGLGGWMLQEGYMLQTAEFASAQYQIREKIEALIGAEQTQTFYDAWLANHMTEADVLALKSWGFNSVRLPMHYNLYTLSIQDEPVEGENTWLTKGFEMTDQLIEWCKQNDMYVVLDLHAAPGGQGYDQAISDYDPSLPSVWESDANKDKTVALWKELATRYKDEPTVAGYDLLNEPNWDLGQNQAMRELYVRITDAIREVDQQHIIFIEGNWFANDFTGLTPPWDDNLVYSPHKYWSFNDEASIQWVLDIREEHNVPLYLGESGENSNTWFKDAIDLLERNNIGWAWWPLKKIEAIAGPLSVKKTEGYNQLLEYWKGNAPQPSSADAFAALMEITENLRIENCDFNQGVIDAMFRQQNDQATLPFAENEVPGVVYASDYDLGENGLAYSDIDVATYHVSTNNYTAWNNGWQYRNDGVDIQNSEDVTNTNGYNVAWTETDEWLKYTCNVQSSGVYDLHLRVASPGGGQIAFEVDDAKASEAYPVPNTGDYQAWDYLVVPNVVLNAGPEEITCHIVEAGFNFGSIEFKYKSSSDQLPYTISRAVTLDNQHIELQLNKPIGNVAALGENNFVLEVDGDESSIVSVVASPNSARKIIIESEALLRSNHNLRVSYFGSSIQATDNTVLGNFEKYFVENLLNPVKQIPGKIEAESFDQSEGVETEDCSDLGQGLNIGYLDAGDFVEYKVNVAFDAPYKMTFRVASQNTTGQIRWQMLDLEGNSVISEELSFPITGGWQVWQDVESEVELESGDYIMRIDILNAPFNLNWISFESLLVVEPPELGIRVFPTLFNDELNLEAVFSNPHQVTYTLYDMSGKMVQQQAYNYATEQYLTLPIDALNAGLYLLEVRLENDKVVMFRVMKY